MTGFDRGRRPGRDPTRPPARVRPRPETPQMVRFADRTGRPRLLCLDRYADRSSREAWDYSAWVRAYGVYLDERLEAFRCAV